MHTTLSTYYADCYDHNEGTWRGHYNETEATRSRLEDMASMYDPAITFYVFFIDLNMINIFEVPTLYKPNPSGQPIELTSLTLVVLVCNIMRTTVVFDTNKCVHQLAYLHQM